MILGWGKKIGRQVVRTLQHVMIHRLSVRLSLAGLFGWQTGSPQTILFEVAGGIAGRMQTMRHVMASLRKAARGPRMSSRLHCTCRLLSMLTAGLANRAPHVNYISHPEFWLISSRPLCLAGF